MIRIWQKVLPAACVASLLALLGCRQQAVVPTTPEALFEQFNQAMAAGDHAAAADLVDYDALAAASNESWDTFGGQQRKLITEKMQEATLLGLQSMPYPSNGMSLASASQDGGQALLRATGGDRQLTLRASLGADGGWRLTGGVPGMTSESGMQ